MTPALSASLAPYALAALAVIYAVLLWPACRVVVAATQPKGDRMSFRERIRIAGSLVLAYLTFRGRCCLCGYGIWWPAGFREGPDVPHRAGRDIDGRRVWAHRSCCDYVEE